MRYRLRWKSYRRTLRVPLRTAHGPWTEREGVIVRLEAENERVGFGEIAPVPWFGTETLAETQALLAALGPTPDDAVLDGIGPRFGCVRFAFGEARGPVERAKISERLAVAALLPAGRAAPRVLVEKLAAGFLAFKWKVAVEAVDEELGLLEDLLAELPAHAKLRLDANGGWTRRQAARWLDRCADRPVEFVEQPLAVTDEDGLRGLAEDFPVTLALDESVVRLDAARRWQAQGWPGVFVVKPAIAGPIPELVAWIAETKADVVFSSALETALGRGAILRLALRHSANRRALGFGVSRIFGHPWWDGPDLGPLADAAAIASDAGEQLWNALS